MLGLGKKQHLTKTVRRESMKPATRKVSSQVAHKSVKKSKPIKESNPYINFINEGKITEVEDLTRYFEFRNSRSGTKAAMAVSAMTTAMSMLLVIYYPFMQGIPAFSSLSLGQLVAGILMVGVAGTMALVVKQAKKISRKETDRQFKMFLRAKAYLARPPVVEQVEIEQVPMEKPKQMVQEDDDDELLDALDTDTEA